MASKGQSQESESKNNDAEIDKELDALLDSALEDFGEGKKPAESGQKGAKSEQKAAESSSKVPPAAPTSSTDDALSDMFTEEFSEEMAKQFEDAMKSFMADDPSMLQQIEKMAEAAGSGGDSAQSGKEFQDTLKETLSSLAQNTENLQDHAAQGPTAAGGVNPEEMMKMFSSMGLEGVDPDEGFMPMMQGMMKTLLSKDVLYPSLKEIGDKYPDWLKENEGKVSDADHKKYTNQYEIIKTILDEFDKEKATDAEDVKKNRFDYIMERMQRMQDLGQPPSAIVGDMAPGLEFDANGVPKFPMSPESCAVM